MANLLKIVEEQQKENLDLLSFERAKNRYLEANKPKDDSKSKGKAKKKKSADDEKWVPSEELLAEAEKHAEASATGIPEFIAGDTVRVHSRIREGKKERIQVYEGTVIRRLNKGLRSTFTVRRIAYGTGSERTFPLYSPNINKIEVTRFGDVRRAKLYYLRDRTGKAARIKERRRIVEKGQ